MFPYLHIEERGPGTIEWAASFKIFTLLRVVKDLCEEIENLRVQLEINDKTSKMQILYYEDVLRWYDEADPEQFELDCGERAGRVLSFFGVSRGDEL